LGPISPSSFIQIRLPIFPYIEIEEKRKLYNIVVVTLTFKEVYIVKSSIEYLAKNLYQVDKIFVDWFELYSDFAALSTKKKRSKRQVQK
jgi:hypothetical protein